MNSIGKSFGSVFGGILQSTPVSEKKFADTAVMKERVRDTFDLGDGRTLEHEHYRLSGGSKIDSISIHVPDGSSEAYQAFNGVIDWEEHADAPQGELQHMVEEYDRNGDGQSDYRATFDLVQPPNDDPRYANVTVERDIDHDGTFDTSADETARWNR